MILDAEPREVERHHDRADPRRGTQQAKAKRADIKDVSCKDRHQRHCAAQQHGKEIKRDGTQNDLLLLDEVKTGKQCRQRGLLRVILSEERAR